MNVITTTTPHPTPPVTDHERIVQCLCLQDSKKDDEVAVPDSMSQPRVPKCYPKGMILWCFKQKGFGSFRFVSVRGNLKHGRFGSSVCRFVSVRVTWRFGSVRVV